MITTEEKKIAFLNYINAFKKLDTISKRNQYIDSIKELIAIFEGFAYAENMEFEYLTSREVMDLDFGNESEDDFLEAALVYLEISKDIIGQYLSKKQL